MKKFFKRIFLKFKAMDSLTKVVFTVFIILAIATSVMAYGFIRNLTTSMTILNLPGAPILESLVNSDGEEEESDQTVSQAAAVATPEPWDGSSRVTILILGLDYNDWRAGDTPHSDSMMLLTIDPVEKTAAMLSIPRDMWVNIPGFDYGRINEAYFDGEAYSLPGGGAELARQTVEQFIGVPIQYYAVIQFDAFVKIVDELGGVQVKPDQYVCVEEYCGSNESKLQPGVNYTLDGTRALAYIRERHTEGGDIDRANRQQQVILSLRNRVLNLMNLPNFLASIPALYEDVSSGISTNINLTDIIKLGTLALQLDKNNISRAVIDYTMVLQDTSPDGESILKAIPEKIRALRDEIFASGGTLTPMATANENSTLLQDEAASIVIWNGTGDSDLGNRTADYLRSMGINVVQVAEVGYESVSKIEIFKGKPYAVNYLSQLMSISSSSIWNSYDPTAGTDIRLTIGGDWAQNNTLQ